MQTLLCILQFFCCCLLWFLTLILDLWYLQEQFDYNVLSSGLMWEYVNKRVSFLSFVLLFDWWKMPVCPFRTEKSKQPFIFIATVCTVCKMWRETGSSTLCNVMSQNSFRYIASQWILLSFPLIKERKRNSEKLAQTGGRWEQIILYYVRHCIIRYYALSQEIQLRDFIYLFIYSKPTQRKTRGCIKVGTLKCPVS